VYETGIAELTNVVLDIFRGGLINGLRKHAVHLFAPISTKPYSRYNKTPIRIEVLSKIMADRTRLELATSGVTGRHSNQLNYRSTVVILDTSLLERSGG
jgi:hypothetical protein